MASCLPALSLVTASFRRFVAVLALLALTAGGLRGQVEPAALVAELGVADHGAIWSLSDRLAKIGEDAVPALRAGLETERESVVLGSARALMKIGDEEPAEKALLMLIKSARDDALRRLAISVFVQEKISEAAEPLWNLRTEVLSPETRIELMRGIWHLSSTYRQRSANELKQMLESSNDATRNGAALALADIKDYDTALPYLEKLEKEPTAAGERARLYLEMRTLNKYLEMLAMRDGPTTTPRAAEPRFPLIDEAMRMIKQAHNEVKVQGWNDKELESY
ncbi:MAG: HEAT repeat domain-containing protein, partial [Salinibacterium sp.]|nr:HEAT repeat domain-containing protein [Salinibacterium sp.]